MTAAPRSPRTAPSRGSRAESRHRSTRPQPRSCLLRPTPGLVRSTQQPGPATRRSHARRSLLRRRTCEPRVPGHRPRTLARSPCARSAAAARAWPWPASPRPARDRRPASCAGCSPRMRTLRASAATTPHATRAPIGSDPSPRPACRSWRPARGGSWLAPRRPWPRLR